MTDRLMADESSDEQGGGRRVDPNASTQLEVKPTPSHASEYYSPVSPPKVSSHKTLETELVRVDRRAEREAVTLPSVRKQQAPTQPSLEPAVVAGGEEPRRPAKIWIGLTVVLGVVAVAAFAFSGGVLSGRGSAASARSSPPSTATATVSPSATVPPPPAAESTDPVPAEIGVRASPSAAASAARRRGEDAAPALSAPSASPEPRPTPWVKPEGKEPWIR